MTTKQIVKGIMRERTRLVKQAKRMPSVKEELKDFRRHFKHDGWSLAYVPYEDLFANLGVYREVVAPLLVSIGLKIRYCKNRQALMITK